MSNSRGPCWACCLLLALAAGSVAPLTATEPVTLDNVVDPGPNTPDEPLAAEFSRDKAVHFLDSAALQWQKQRKCFTCHTNYAFLYARPTIDSQVEAHRQVRLFAEQLVSDRWRDKGPRWDAEVVATAAALAHNDRATTGKLHPLTRTALDRMWTLQRDDGGWTWLKCDWPPMESDDHYGATLAALAAGVAPENYAATDAARKGLDGIRRYLQQNPPPTLHHQAMILWASKYVDGLLTEDQRKSTIEQLQALQNADGGWGLGALGDWKRADGTEQDKQTSDGYGTGLVIYVLRMADVPADDPQILRGLGWLKSHQRASGRWFTRSLHQDSKHYISHAGTAMALLALSACEDLPRSAP
jgi:squalene-hopene/tetraprenyl-beta-curcumene cyclase